MKIQIYSTHDLFDNRINRHLTTLIKNNYQIEYVNCSKSNVQDFELGFYVILHHINEPFIKSNLKGVIKALRIMRKYLIKGNADIVHIHDPLLIPLFYYARKLNIGTVYDKHESYENISGLNSKIGTIFERTFVKYIDSVIYVNEKQSLYLDSLGYKHKRMIPNYQSAGAYNISRNRTNDNNVQFVYIGSLYDDERNINLMLDIMCEVMEKCTNIKFILGGSTTDKIINKKILQLSQKFHGFEYKGLIKYSEVINITINSDIGIYFAKDSLNNESSSPNKVYEYMIAGVALVGMGTFMHADEIDNYAGKIFDFKAEPNEIVSYIVSLINDPNRLNLFKANAKIIGNKYTWESVEGRYKEIYEITNKAKLIA